MSRNSSQSIALRLASKYNTDIDLVLELVDLLGRDEAVQTLQMAPNQLRNTARVNTHKSSRQEVIDKLAQEGVTAKAIKELPEAIEVFKGGRKLGSSLTYLSGEVMPQGLASMLTVQALDPQPGEIILDMAAAPGGKSCFIGERLRGEGLIIANDISRKRIRSLLFNLTRHGIVNTRIINRDGRYITSELVGHIDKVLLDAPCSGGGLLVSKPERKQSKSVVNSIQLQHTQVALLKTALKLLQSGGSCVYATCAISPLENEQVVKTVLPKVDIVPIDIAGNPGSTDEGKVFAKAKRLYPSIHRCDGFFIARMEKI